jgi:hypothetical protein
MDLQTEPGSSPSTLVNTPIFSDFLGTLGASGEGTSQLDTQGPLPPGASELTMYFAYFLNMPIDYASNPVAIDIMP